MWIGVLLSIVNAGLLFLSRLLHIPGIDIVPAAMVLAASSQESILLVSLLLLLPYFTFSPGAIAHGWYVAPLVLIVGFLAYLGLPAMVCLLLYYVLGVGVALWLGQLGPRYMSFLVTNAILNGFVVFMGNKVF